MKQTYYNPEVLVSWRKSLGMTQQRFADLLGVHQTTVARIERGRHFSLEYITAAARVAGQNYESALTEQTKNKYAPITLSS